MTVTVVDASAAGLPSRRALLAGALGGLGAVAAGMLGRAPSVRAEGEAMVVGGEYLTAQSRTHLRNQANGNDVFEARSDSGGAGVIGRSVNGNGVYGFSTNVAGVFGDSDSAEGVSGFSTTGVGVRGHSVTVQGVIGTGAIGVEGTSDSQYAWGVGGYNSVSGGIGVWGQAFGAGSRGVSGFSAVGRGVHGESSSGFAGYFKGKVYTSKFHEMREIGTPNAPAANKGRLFMRDNGSGKTQLCVRFSSGAVQVLATQP